MAGADFILHVSPATLQALRPGDPPIEFDVQREARACGRAIFALRPMMKNCRTKCRGGNVASGPGAGGACQPGDAGGGHVIPSPPYMSPDTAPVTVPPPSSGRSPRAPGAESDATGPLAGAARRPGGEPVGVPPSSVRPEQNGMEQNRAQARDAGQLDFRGIDHSGDAKGQRERGQFPAARSTVALDVSTGDRPVGVANSYIGWLFLGRAAAYRGLLARPFPWKAGRGGVVLRARFCSSIR